MARQAKGYADLLLDCVAAKHAPRTCTFLQTANKVLLLEVWHAKRNCHANTLFHVPTLKQQEC